MRKVLNKKGFSLVELMIVVVIMGILIAVAIPLYGAITENAERRTCQANQDNMHSMFAKYCVMDDRHNATNLLPNGSYNSKTSGEGDIDPTYLASFDGGFPTCSLEGHYYVITRVSDYEIKVECFDADGNLETSHNAN